MHFNKRLALTFNASLHSYSSHCYVQGLEVPEGNIPSFMPHMFFSKILFKLRRQGNMSSTCFMQIIVRRRNANSNGTWLSGCKNRQCKIYFCQLLIKSAGYPTPIPGLVMETTWVTHTQSSLV